MSNCILPSAAKDWIQIKEIEALMHFQHNTFNDFNDLLEISQRGLPSLALPICIAIYTPILQKDNPLKRVV